MTLRGAVIALVETKTVLRASLTVLTSRSNFLQQVRIMNMTGYENHRSRFGESAKILKLSRKRLEHIQACLGKSLVFH